MHSISNVHHRFHIGLSSKWKKGDDVGPIQHAVFEGEIDMTGSPQIMTKERMDFVSFVHQSWPIRYLILYYSST